LCLETESSKMSDEYVVEILDADIRIKISILCTIAEVRKSSEWSAWYRESNASASDGRTGHSEERYRCVCQADVSHSSQLRQPIIRKTQRSCSTLHGCTAGFCIVITSAKEVMFSSSLVCLLAEFRKIYSTDFPKIRHAVRRHMATEKNR